MFNIGWSEMLVVAAIALIVVGPKDLPALLRQLGKAFGTIRRMGNDFKREINKVAALDEVNDIKKSITEPLKNTHEELTNQFNVMDDDGVRPSGALKPKTEGAESVADEIREAVGMEPDSEPKTNAAADSMKATIAAAQEKQAKKRAAEAEAAAKAEQTAKAETKPATAKKPAAKRTTAARKPAAKKTAAKSTTARKPATRKPAAKKAATKKPAAKRTTTRKTATAKSGDAK